MIHAVEAPPRQYRNQIQISTNVIDSLPTPRSTTDIFHFSILEFLSHWLIHSIRPWPSWAKLKGKESKASPLYTECYYIKRSRFNLGEPNRREDFFWPHKSSLQSYSPLRVSILHTKNYHKADFLHFCLERLQRKYSDLVGMQPLNVMKC